ncbi:IclR family transcriptional regulator [Nocardioides sp. GY 10113]|uniref:IclR family transcriptional regulator n=1 Tax=Nocardioides sp. GY 10113 TaxID=2569761 RepID=UPI0010A92A29|nr:IclR family transcriptional regulator [Nocardioides sp. GY 10113]TIC88879.1 IclR family transcriptional regulator [Nocardioides sp. GY 10113]
MSESGPVGEDSPAIRLFALMELIVAKDAFVSLQSLTAETQIPKPTLHRMLQQLEGAGLLIRQGDGRHYGTGPRLRRFAESLLLNATQHGARHAVLRDLVEDLGETCAVSTISGNEVLYVDVVDSPYPLRFVLDAGARAPIHCTASGKMGLSQMSPGQRRRLLEPARLAASTPRTITDLDALEEELLATRERGWALDLEEYQEGLVCAAVPIPHPGRSNLFLAVQAPAMRMSEERARAVLPALQDAARAIRTIEDEGSS